jgi:hypothetical protein
MFRKVEKVAVGESKGFRNEEKTYIQAFEGRRKENNRSIQCTDASRMMIEKSWVTGKNIEEDQGVTCTTIH